MDVSGVVKCVRAKIHKADQIRAVVEGWYRVVQPIQFKHTSRCVSCVCVYRRGTIFDRAFVVVVWGYRVRLCVFLDQEQDQKRGRGVKETKVKKKNKAAKNSRPKACQSRLWKNRVDQDLNCQGNQTKDDKKK